MDDRKVIPVVQGLQKMNGNSVQLNSSVDKPEMDWIEGDADFDVYQDDDEWYE